ncbi:DDB1- and CUL4-associated factor 10-like isoform X2 [Styela clava]
MLIVIASTIFYSWTRKCLLLALMITPLQFGIFAILKRFSICKEVFRLRGHTSWVKNIEFHQPSKQLVSSGFDDTIRVWDINNVKDDENVETRVLLTVGGLLRIRLSPAGDNLYLSSSTFHEVIGINNLDLSSIEDDIGFIRAENDFLGLITKKRTIPSFNHLTQTKPVTRRNQIDRYRGCGSPVLDMYGDDIVGHSIDVHPNNSAILLHCIGAFDKVVYGFISVTY